MTVEKKLKLRMPKLAREIWSSKLSILGASLVTVAGVLIITALLLDIGLAASSYRGLIAYGLMPAVFVIGLLLIPLGIFLAHRKARKSGQPVQPLLIDLGRPDHRRRLVFIFVLTLINSVILTLALYEGYRYTDSNQFCGLLCHTVMKPEYVTYQRSPHARVRCVDCHIGSGTSWYIRSKLSGLRQVWAVLTNSYEQPIPTPVENLRPARETCEECHWPQVFHGNKIIARRMAAENSDDDPVNAVSLKIGGFNSKLNRYEGIHWHVSKAVRVEYMPADNKRQKIKRIRVFGPKAGQTLYEMQDMPEPPAGTPWRTMDCLDCHNRPSHRFDRAEDVVDQAILNGNLPRGARIREMSIGLLTAAYGPGQNLEKELPKKLQEYYRANNLALPVAAEQDKICKVLNKIYQNNVFPQMKIGFGTYASHIGHRDEQAGCFRCHDGEHVAENGKSIAQDCDLCHEILLQEEPFNKINPEILKLIPLEIRSK
jgi:hypothetical protein